VLGDNHPNVSSGMSNLGLVLADKGDYVAAAALFREALVIRRRAMGPHNPALAVTLNNLAYPLRELRQYDGAIGALEEALELSIPSDGDESPTVANYRGNLARVYLATRDAVRAEPLLRRSLATRLRTYGDNDWRVAMTKSLLGSALTMLARFPEAESLLLDAKRVLKPGPDREGREAQATLNRLQTLYDTWRRSAASGSPKPGSCSGPSPDC